MLDLICHGNWPGYDIIGRDPSTPGLLTDLIRHSGHWLGNRSFSYYSFVPCSLSCPLSLGERAVADTAAQ